MPDITSAEIESAYRDVRYNSNDVTVCSINPIGSEYTAPLLFRGENAYEEFLASLKDDEVTFAYAKVIFSPNPDAIREKFVRIIWIGESVNVKRKAQVSLQAVKFKTIFHEFDTELTTNSLDEITTEAIQNSLLKKFNKY